MCRLWMTARPTVPADPTFKMHRLYVVLILLHAYIGWRLLPGLLSFGMVPAALLLTWLVLSAWLMPKGFFARRSKHHTLSDALIWAGTIAMGSFSSLFVLTFLRDVALLVAGALDLALPNTVAMGPLQAWSAVAVPVLAALMTLLGLYNARRRAVVRSVDVSIAGLPPALHG